MNKISIITALSLYVTAISATPPLHTVTRPDVVHRSAKRLPIRLHDTPESRYVLEQVSFKPISDMDGVRHNTTNTIAVQKADSTTGTNTVEKKVYDGAHIEFKTATHDFGDVARRGGDITAEFEYVNDGTEPLVITRITTSCTCIKPVYSKRPLEAGERGVIKLVYEPHKMEAGAFHKVVQVHTNSVGGVRLLTVQGHSVNGRTL